MSWGLILTFVKVTGVQLVGRGAFLSPPILNRIKLLLSEFRQSETLVKAFNLLLDFFPYASYMVMKV